MTRDESAIPSYLLWMNDVVTLSRMLFQFAIYAMPIHSSNRNVQYRIVGDIFLDDLKIFENNNKSSSSNGDRK